MATVFITDCPHCGVARVAAKPIGVVAPAARRGIAAFSCNNCRELIGVSFSHTFSSPDWVMQSEGDFVELGRHGCHLEILDQYPKAPPMEAPDGVSQAVQRAFLQGLDNAVRRNSDAAASMFRKAIDIATRELDQSLAGKVLAKRIDLLADAGRLTRDLQEWAHLIRLDGNQGAHDDVELSTAEIAQLQDFTRLFLVYTFTLPEQVNARKAAAAAQ